MTLELENKEDFRVIFGGTETLRQVAHGVDDPSIREWLESVATGASTFAVRHQYRLRFRLSRTLQA